jgi:hypothetical protein
LVTGEEFDMVEEMKQMKPIWYFVGLTLLLMGGIIFLAGLYHLIVGTQRHEVLAQLYPDVWWGGIMLVIGFVFFWTSRKAKV